MEPEIIAALLPLALGHDQEATACPWVAITRQTADYPSRKAQAALAVATGMAPATYDLVDLLYRCDHCGRCRAASTLPEPLDLARALWSIRSTLVEAGEVPEVSALTERSPGLDPELMSALLNLGTGEETSDVLFVPGASMLSLTPDAAISTLGLLQALDIRVDIQPDLVDSGQELLELGLSTMADRVQVGIRQRVSDGGYRLVIAGTPKEAFGLREALGNSQVEVRYAGQYIAEHFERMPPPNLNGKNAVLFHPSEVLLHRLEGFEAINWWLDCWLGDRYRQENDPRRHALPAAIERPSPRMPEHLSRKLAEQRLHQILTASRIDSERLTILTSDPYSLVALQGVAPQNVEVQDLLVFASQMIRREVAVDG